MRIKVGIIGAGNMGKNHVRLAKELVNEFELIGVFDPSDEQIKVLGLEDIRYTDQNALIEDADAIITAAPSFLHKDIALSVAEHNKHLLVEKPLALSAKDAEMVKNAFDETGKVLTVGHVERFNPVITELEKIVKKEKIIAVHIERCSSKDLRIKDTDVIYDLMIHDVDILMNSINPDAALTQLSCYGTRVYSPKYLDYVESIMEFNNGVIASIISSRATENKIRKIAIHCENAFIDADLLNRTLTISRKTDFTLDVGYSPVYKQENITERVFVSNEEPLKAELKDFHKCITTNSVPKNNAATALRSIRVLDSISDELYR